MEVDHKLLYVVQRCWHSGRQQYAPCDLLRLFHTQKEAEETAYHSAKAFHNAWVASTNTNSKSIPGVKTLLLPSYPNHNPQGSSYGFLSCGCLFWVRFLRATIVTAKYQQQQQQQQQNKICGTQAYAILTESVIGGTGNRNSRRGTEVCDGRAFCGDALARQVAMEAVARVKASYCGSASTLSVEIRTLPIGKPTESSYTTGDFLNDWPQEVILQRPDISTMTDDNNTNKRHQISTGSSNGGEPMYDSWGRTVSQESGPSVGGEEEVENVDYIVVDCPFEQPVAKRRRTDMHTDMDSAMGADIMIQ